MTQKWVVAEGSNTPLDPIAAFLAVNQLNKGYFDTAIELDPTLEIKYLRND